MRRHDFDWTEGSLSPEEVVKLRSLARKADGILSPPYGAIIEFGTLIGITAQALAFAAPSKGIYTVDCYRWNPWGLTPKSHRALAWQMLVSLSNAGRVAVVDSHKEDFQRSGWNCSVKPSLVFIDADHSYKSVKADIAWARSVGAAIICGHDYYADGSKHPGVAQAVDEAGGPKELVGSLWVL